MNNLLALASTWQVLSMDPKYRKVDVSYLKFGLILRLGAWTDYFNGLSESTSIEPNVNITMKATKEALKPLSRVLVFKTRLFSRDFFGLNL